MAQNPFYPGYAPYKQGQTPINPLSFGYYPGKKIPKRPIHHTGALVDLPPGSGMSDLAGEELDRLAEGIGSTLTGFPAWVKDRLVDDAQSAFVIRANAPKNVAETSLDDYGTEAVPGAGYVTFDLDPTKWAKDPKKMLKKTLQGWVKGAINFTDFENEARQHFWKALLTKEEIIPGVGRTGESMAAVEALVEQGLREENARRAAAGLPLIVTRKMQGPIKNPLYISPDSDYADVPKQLTEFMINAQSPLYRDLKHDTVTLTISKGFSQELFRKQERGLVLNTDQTIAVASFTARTEFAEILGYIGKAREETTKLLKKICLNGGLEGDDISALQGHLGNLQKNAKSLRDRLNDPTQRGYLVATHGEAFVTNLEKRLGLLEQVFVNPKDPDKKTLFQRIIELPPNSRVTYSQASQLWTAIDLPLGRKGNKEDATTVLMGILSGVDFTGGDVLGPSYQRQILRGLTTEMTGDTPLRHIISDPKSNPDLEFDAKKLLVLIPRMDYERDLQAILEVFDVKFSSLLERYGWSNRLGRPTTAGFKIWRPKDFIAYQLGLVQSFGLTLDEERLQRMRFYEKASRNYNSGPNRVFGNHFTAVIGEGKNKLRMGMWGGNHMKVIGNATFKDMFSNDVFISKFLIQGLTLDNFGKWVDGKFVFNTNIDPDIQKMLGLLLEGKKQTDVETFFKDLTTFREYINRRLIKDNNANLSGDAGFWKDLFTALGGNFASSNLITRRYIGFLERISQLQQKTQIFFFHYVIERGLFKIPYFGNLAKKGFARYFMGKEVLRYKLMDFKNQITKILLDKFGNLIKGALEKASAYFAKIAAKVGAKVALSAFLTTLSQTLGSLVPVIGNIIGAIVSWIVEKIIKKLWDVVKKLFKNVKRYLTGDFTSFYRDFEKDYQRKVDNYLKILGVIVMILLAFGSLLGVLTQFIRPIISPVTRSFRKPIITLLSTFSPVDMTRVHGSVLQNFSWNIDIGLDNTTGLPIGGGAGVGGGGGGGVFAGGGDVVGNNGCFTYVNNASITATDGSSITSGVWGPTEISKMEEMVLGLRTGTRGYLDRLCAGAGSIPLYVTTLRRSWCAERTGNNGILFWGNSACFPLGGSVGYNSYLLAHETGHIYSATVGYEQLNGLSLATARVTDGGSLPTYPLNCSNSVVESEDFAETVGDFVAANLRDCASARGYGSYQNFWSAFPGHWEYANSVLFR